MRQYNRKAEKTIEQNRTVQIILCLILAWVLSAAVPLRTKAAADKTLEMKQVGTGTYTNTVKIGSQRYIYHKVTVKKAGILRFSATARRGKGISRGLAGRLVQADKKLRQIRPYYTDRDVYLNAGAHKDVFYSIKKGTYWFRVNARGLSGYTYKLNAVFTPKTKAAAGALSQDTAVPLKKGKPVQGMFWFDGFAGIDPNAYSVKHWFRYKAKAGREVQLWYWSNYHVPDLYLPGVASEQVSSKLKTKGDRKYTILRFTPQKSEWMYVYIDNPAYEKLYTLMVR